MPFKIIDWNGEVVGLEDYELEAVLRIDSMNQIPRSYKGNQIRVSYQQVNEEEAEKIRERLNKRNLATLANK